MDTESITYLGVNIKSRDSQICFAALDHEVRLIALSVGSMQDVMAYIAGQKCAVIGINGPSHINLGLAKERINSKKLDENPDSITTNNMRLCELELLLRGYSPVLTPSTITKCPKWVRSSFSLFRYCERLGYEIYNNSDKDKLLYEVNSEVNFGFFSNSNLLDKTLLESRLQRQLILYEMGLDIPDPMNYYEELTRHRLIKGILPLEDIYTIEELNAMAAAFSVFLISKDPLQAEWLGDPQEGQIAIPPGRIK